VTRNQPVMGARALKKSLCFLPKLESTAFHSQQTTCLSTIQISISRIIIIIIIIQKILFSMTGNVFLPGKFHDKKNYEGAYLTIAVTMLHNTVTDL